MKVKVITKDNSEAGSIELPKQFEEPLRGDLITRAVLAIQATNRQPYGGYGDAGMHHSTKISRRRRDYKTSYGHGISRVPRKILNRRGRRMGWVGALSPGTVGGRRAHPPKPYSDWEQKINVAENRKAIRSALAATMQPETVTKRGHKIPSAFPFIIDDSFEQFKKTADLEDALVKLGFAAEIERSQHYGIRAGRGKLRGRKHKSPTSILFVVSKDATSLVHAARNLPGSDVVSVHRVNTELLAPGTHPGRLTLYTKTAIERLEKEALFTTNRKITTQNKRVKKTQTAEKTEKTEKTSKKVIKNEHKTT